MNGAARRDEHRRADIWFTAMMPHLKEPPDLEQFVYGQKNSRRELSRCLEAWDKVDAALNGNKAVRS